ncbi:hypothetical protein [Desulfovibrio litoralis]|uniref:Uncharacterized protein n=1 Tax=Desulfovibrio litoralis DSM 11393 TaxID=1121455 RepID=A0A1M7TLA9_9BACT|nr:hypothetical protein [Desulfovibrio litoralis]SHN71495.1 hypothetical protein SAMN02745728_02197 [Desulfovibrio litoralis DSM 11393]
MSGEKDKQIKSIVEDVKHASNWLDTLQKEYGHHVMDDSYENSEYSWKHKGTSTTFGNDIEKNKADLASIINKLMLGKEKGKIEFDLMQYWKGSLSVRVIEHMRASNDEVRGAIWLSRMKFKLKLMKEKS